jgi:hypothetical protein
MAERSFSEQLQKSLADSLGDNEPFPWPEADSKSLGSSERIIEREPEIDIEIER